MPEEDCLAHSYSFGVFYPNLVAPVVISRGPNVEAGLCVFFKGLPLARHDVQFYGTAKWREGIGVEVVLLLSQNSESGLGRVHP